MSENKPSSYDIEIFNQIINDKIKQDAKNGILNEKSLKTAKWMMEQAKKKLARDLMMMNIQLLKIFNTNQNKTLKECLDLKIYL